MGTFLLYVGVLAVIGVTLAATGSWASRKSSAVRNVVGFLLAAVSSYAAGFVLDMLAQAATGCMPPNNIIAPSFTWLAITLSAFLSALRSGSSPYALATPFAANAVVALLASASHPRNTVIGLVLLAFSVLPFLLRRHRVDRVGTKPEGAPLPDAADRDMRRANRIIREAEAEVARTTKPLGAVGLAIVRASQTCSEAIRPLINGPEGKEKQEAEMYVFYEFIYFFMHLAMRSAFSQLTEQQIEGLQGYLGPLISSTAVDSFFGHWPEDLKEKIRSGFFAKLNDAEVEYSTCKELLCEESPLTGNSLLSRLARNIGELSGNSSDPGTFVIVISSAVDAIKATNLDSLVREAGKVL